MIKTPITRDKLKNHWHYTRFIYLLAIVLTLVLCSMYSSMVGDGVASKDSLEIFLCGDYTGEEYMGKLRAYCQDMFPELRKVEVSNISSDLMGSEDYAMQQIIVYMAAGEGDLYFLPADMYRVMQNTGVYLALDEVLADGSLTVDAVIDISGGYAMVEEKAWSGEVVSQEGPYLFAIPTDELFGLWTEFGIDNRNKYLVVCFDTENLEQCVTFINQIARRCKADRPDWLDEYEKVEAQLEAEELESLREQMQGTPLELIEDNNHALGKYQPY